MGTNVSIIVACYNEEPHLKENVAKIETVFAYLNWSYEFIFVEDCSTDDTKSVLKSLLINNPKYKIIYHEQNAGRGKTVCDGIRLAQGQVVGFLDIDLEVHARYLPSFIDPILRGLCDVTIAHRVYNISPNPSILIRHFLSHSYRRLTRLVIGLNVRDSEAGFKFFDRQKILPLIDQCQSFGWFWDTEIMALCEKQKLKIQEIEALFIRRSEKKSTVKLFRDSIRSFIELLRFRNKLNH